jgi:hypothetical protein
MSNRAQMIANISLQPTGISVKHFARMKSKMLATDARG